MNYGNYDQDIMDAGRCETPIVHITREDAEKLEDELATVIAQAAQELTDKQNQHVQE